MIQLRDMHVNLKQQNEPLPLEASGVNLIPGLCGRKGAQIRPGFADQLTLCEEIE